MRNATLVLGLIFVTASLSWGAAADDGSFTVGIMGDRTGGHIEGVYPRLIGEMALRDPGIVLTVGDHIEGYGDNYELAAAQWDTIAAMYEAVTVPVYMTPGNHDIWSDESAALWTEATGHAPYYSFDHGNAHFIVLDVSRTEEVSAFPEVQMEWLLSDLDANSDAEHTYVFLHKPLWLQTLANGREDALHDVFREHGVEAVFAGHHHTYYSAEYDGIPYYAIGSSGGSMSYEGTHLERGNFFHFGMLTVTPEGHELVLIHEGEAYPSDVVTIESLEEIARIESELIDITPVRAADRSAPSSYPVTVSVTNDSEEVINTSIVWEMSETWNCSPTDYPFRLTPGESGDFEFRFLNAGDIYPVPRLMMQYPLGEGELGVMIDLPLKRAVKAVRFGLPPEIDGKLTEDAWPTDGPVPTLFPAWEGVEVDGETGFFFGYDSDNLYLGAICFDDEIDGIATGAGERDGAVYLDDCVGYFLHPRAEEATVYQVYVNAAGEVFDQMITFAPDSAWYETDVDWDCDVEVATHRGEAFWSMEMRIPHEAVGGEAEYGASWGVNFRRKQPRTESAVDWQVPIDYDPETLGELDFQ